MVNFLPLNLVRASLLACLMLAGPYALADKAPDFTLATDNGQLQLSQLQGKVVYLDFWASWCGPCRKSFPWMNEMQARYGDQGLVVLAVNLDNDTPQAKKFLEQYPAQFRIAYDPEGRVPALYGVKGMPSSFFIDRDGQLHSSHVGFREKDQAPLEAAIQALLGK